MMRSLVSFASVPRYLPLFLLVTLLPAAGFAQAKVNFEKDILPVLERSCIECHKAPYEEDGRTKKPKAALRLDGAWAVMLGSENGAVVVPGKGEESELWIRVSLPPDDDEYMPPTDKAPELSAKEKELLKRWINEGADFGGWAGSLEGKPAEVANTGDKIPESELQVLYETLSEGLKPSKEEQWEVLGAGGGRVQPLADGSPLLGVDFRQGGKETTDESLAGLKALAPNIAQLDLSKTGITDAALAQIGSMERLVRLDLHLTEVGDASLGKLSGLKHLRYLNLYGTQVTDKGLQDLAKIKSLRKVYLWQSQATPAGAKKLQKALPEAEISWE